MVTYLQGQLNKRVGGGECSHLAIEALRVGGGEFVASDLGTDNPDAGDLVWGSRVARISSSSSDNSDQDRWCRPGDVIQFSSAEFDVIVYPKQFTAVVATVNDNGRPDSVFQQNFDGNRIVQQVTIDTNQLTSGWLRIYRPIARIDRFNEWKFTIVNNCTSNQGYQVLTGISADTVVTLTSSTTADSYRVHSITTDGTVPNFLLSNQQSFFVETGKGNEAYDSTMGTAIRQLSQ